MKVQKNFHRGAVEIAPNRVWHIKTTAILVLKKVSTIGRYRAQLTPICPMLECPRPAVPYEEDIQFPQGLTTFYHTNI